MIPGTPILKFVAFLDIRSRLLEANDRMIIWIPGPRLSLEDLISRSRLDSQSKIRSNI